MPYAGEIAAIGTAITWSVSALFFTTASHKIGSFSMSHYRMLFGSVILVFMLLIGHGRLFPAGMSMESFWLLAASGFSGFFLADICLFQSYVDIGPRLGALVFNIYPFFTAFMAYFILGERLSRFAWLGMAVTLTGVVWVVLEKNVKHHDHIDRQHIKRGILLAATGSVFQAVGLIFAKPAMTGELAIDPLTATFIRAIFGGAAYWVVSVLRGRTGLVLDKSANRRVMLLILAGAFFGPSFGVWLSMIAVKLAPLGIAATLMALMPITIIPMTALVYKEKVSWRALIGALVACLGIAILFNS